MDASPIIDSYDWTGGTEAMLRFGPAVGPAVVMALPLFEEANRTRAFGVAMLRALAARGIGGMLPELPGQGESERATEQATLADLRAGFNGAVETLFQKGRQAYVVALRSGIVVAGDAHELGRWCLSPQAGSAVLNELIRALGAARRTAEVQKLRNVWQYSEDRFPIEVVGNSLNFTLAADLMSDRTILQVGSIGIPTRVVRMENDSGRAHRFIPGAPLWRRSEPENDFELADTLAEDIAAWIATCES